jgi:hypothetical protein
MEKTLNKIDFSEGEQAFSGSIAVEVKLPKRSYSYIFSDLFLSTLDPEVSIEIRNFLLEPKKLGRGRRGGGWVFVGGSSRKAEPWICKPGDIPGHCGSWHSHEVGEPKRLRRLKNGTILRTEVFVSKAVVGKLVQSVLAE